MNLVLTGRQQNILLAIVLDYIANADPVGSRTISKKYELGLSPATIRNDMAELEEKGLLVPQVSDRGEVSRKNRRRKNRCIATQAQQAAVRNACSEVVDQCAKPTSSPIS